MPRVVKFVFWRFVSCWNPFTHRVDPFLSILLFYLISILLIGLNGEHLPQPRIPDVSLILNRSPLGLPQSFQ